MSIIDHRQAEENYKAWRKKHPKEAEESDKLFEEWRKNPEALKEFLKRKGFHFTEESK